MFSGYLDISLFSGILLYLFHDFFSPIFISAYQIILFHIRDFLYLPAGVHTTMHDLLPGNVYFRFNPYLSDEIGLDEIAADRLAMMMEDTSLYLRKNEAKIEEAVRALVKSKNPLDRAKDWYQQQSLLWPVY